MGLLHSRHSRSPAESSSSSSVVKVDRFALILSVPFGSATVDNSELVPVVESGVMDEKDVVVAVVQGSVQAVLKPVHDLWNCLVLPRLEGKRDAIYVEQETNLKIVTAKAQKMLADAGIMPEEPRLPVFIPILQQASLEDNETLRTRWAALFANALNPDRREELRVAYTDILRQLSPEDVLFLDHLYDHVCGEAARRYGESGVSPNSVQKADISITGMDTIYHDVWPLPDVSAGDPEGEQRFMDAQRYHISRRAIILRNCERLGLTDRVLRIGNPDKSRFSAGAIPNETLTYLTALGYEFVKACRAPEPVEGERSTT